MAQCYISTYRNHYRWNQPEVEPSCKPVEKFLSIKLPEDIWIEPETTESVLEDEDMLRRIKKTNLKRMISTYQISYCKDMVAKFTGEPIESSFENQLLEYSQKLYEPESRSKISPPLPGTRKVFGYIRPSWNYIPLTNYQYNFGRTAYEILKRNLKRGAEALRNPQSGENDNPVVDGEEKKKHEIAEATCDCRCCVKKLKKKNKCS